MRLPSIIPAEEMRAVQIGKTVTMLPVMPIKPGPYAWRQAGGVFVEKWRI
jgi:hypothetical protein